jgi:hypothetical protein
MLLQVLAKEDLAREDIFEEAAEAYGDKWEWQYLVKQKNKG